jgi:hypothetical protein
VWSAVGYGNECSVQGCDQPWIRVRSIVYKSDQPWVTVMGVVYKSDQWWVIVMSVVYKSVISRGLR